MKSLDRFIEAQDPVLLEVFYELAKGQKRTHWMWFIFPQPEGLGRSEKSVYYALSPEEIEAYREHPELFLRWKTCVGLVVEKLYDGRTLESIFGEVDAMKFRSSIKALMRYGDFPPDDVDLLWKA